MVRKKKKLSPQQEEAIAKARAENLEKARAVRKVAAFTKSSETIWANVEKRRTVLGCTCPIHKGMTLAELRPLGSGCCDHWICPVLDTYRRALEKLQPSPKWEDA